ncbi:MAG: hypothetical protein ACI9W2_001049 [Gammaproteobacteria bacterium]
MCFLTSEIDGIAMTIARAHLIDAVNPGYYHLHSRCVRRAWLCGIDPETGGDFEHRREWIETRLLTLASLFCIELYSYAVMSNHYHVVLRVDPKGPLTWSDQEVARRYLSLKYLFAVDTLPETFPDSFEFDVTRVLASKELLAMYRERLGSVSWFQRNMNQSIARRVNREDGCTGHLWQARFGSNALLDDESVYTAMAYSDLNPVRAGVARTYEQTQHTSIAKRLRDLSEIERDAQLARMPVSGGDNGGQMASQDVCLYPLTLGLPKVVNQGRLVLLLAQYREILRQTKATRNNKGIRGSAIREARVDWSAKMKVMSGWRQRAYGSQDHLRAFAQKVGQSRILGMKRQVR